jgi:SAM-dependent methyltransferase
VEIGVEALKEDPLTIADAELAGALHRQLDYYRARARQYDEARRAFEAGLAPRYAAVLDALAPAGRTLELACGTGRWTEALRPRVDSLTAVDGSPEAIAVARARGLAADVRFVVADLFAWEPDGVYDTVFSAFWISHVPDPLFADFWAMTARALRPGGRALFVETSPGELSAETTVDGAAAPSVTRTLPGGSVMPVVKVFRSSGQMRRAVEALGWECDVWDVDAHFLAGVATRPG